MNTLLLITIAIVVFVLQASASHPRPRPPREDYDRDYVPGTHFKKTTTIRDYLDIDGAARKLQEIIPPGAAITYGLAEIVVKQIIEKHEREKRAERRLKYSQAKLNE